LTDLEKRGAFGGVSLDVTRGGVSEPDAIGHVIVIGAHKAGTTTIHALLDSHPEIAMSVVKETNHHCPNLWPLLQHVRSFSKKEIERLHAKNESAHIGVVKDRAAFASVFPLRVESKYCGEASPFYLRSLDAAKNIAQFRPDTRIIVVLRDPIERLLSHYAMEVRDARIPEPIELAIQEELQALKLGQLPFHGLLDSGLYGQGISRFLEYFSIEQILMLDFAELSDTQRLTSDIADFLRIDPTGFGSGVKNHNESLAARSPIVNRLIAQSGIKALIRMVVPKNIIEALKPIYYQPKARKNLMDEKRHQELLDFFRDDVRQLKNIVGDKKLTWIGKYL
jgi:Sulfotransferase family